MYCIYTVTLLKFIFMSCVWYVATKPPGFCMCALCVRLNRIYCTLWSIQLQNDNVYCKAGGIPFIDWILFSVVKLGTRNEVWQESLMWCCCLGSSWLPRFDYTEKWLSAKFHCEILQKSTSVTNVMFSPNLFRTIMYSDRLWMNRVCMHVFLFYSCYSWVYIDTFEESSSGYKWKMWLLLLKT